jgi:catechol 2,3-dioxygenase-like lactoylglutathione lyase family enzyme
MPKFSSLAIRIANVESMVDFYTEAFHIQFQEVGTYGIKSYFGELNGITLKFVPIRDEADFKVYPIHQPGFVVPDVQAVIDIVQKYGGRQEGRTLRVDGKLQAAIRDPDGNMIELYTEE